MRLVRVYDEPRAVEILYQLLAERPKENWISHTEMPTREEHEAFVHSKPFLYWYLIEEGGEFVGAIECNHRNEMGVSVLRKHQRRGYGTRALGMFIAAHEPLPPIKAERAGIWLANIAGRNSASIRFFKKLGFRHLQETYGLK